MGIIQSLRLKCLLVILAAFMAAGVSATNIAPYATPTTSYVTTWNKLSAINNGVVGYSPAAGGTLGNAETWGSWSATRPASQWLEYDWANSFTVNQVTVYYWVDNLALTGASANVAVPASWTIQYDNNGTWTDVTLLDGEAYTNNFKSPNTVKFADVATKKLRLNMNAQSNGTTYAALGVIEWQVESNNSALADLQAQTDALAVGFATGEDVNSVKSNLTLPALAGTQGVTVSWSSNNTAVISNDGTVTRPDQYDASVVLTATLSQTLDGVTYTLTKKITVIVKAKNATEDVLANWDFDNSLISTDANGNTVVKSNSAYAFNGTIMNNASIRRIGTTNQYNVLYTGNGTGYFDMGTEIGKAIYSLNNFTICGYYRVDNDYTTITSAGNYFFNFSNSDNIPKDLNGYFVCPLNNQSYSITSTNYTAKQEVSAAKAATVGGWHHFAYTQDGTTGTVYVDGVLQKTGTITALPSNTLPIAGRTGTLYNWLGRSCYPSDSYTKKTMIYGFQVLNIPLTVGDLTNGYGDFEPVATTISKLDAAYTENPNSILPELSTEQANLSLGDLSSVTSNLTLPTKGALDNTISIIWKSSNDSLITSAGVVTRPNYFNYTDSLTATLSKNGQKVIKTFYATVLAKEGSKFNGNLLLKFDFANVKDSIVTDAAEKGFKGILKNKATVQSMGLTNKYNVLNLGDSIGYFDMGKEVGKLIYNLSDYTISAYFRINEANADLGKAGNYLYFFSNSLNQASANSGYISCAMNDLSYHITPLGNGAVHQSVAYGQKAPLGGWHNITYVQEGTIGSLYIDGNLFKSATISNLPSTTLPKAYANLLGTTYNFIGRSCYSTDVYLRKALVYDLRVYNKALTLEDVAGPELNVYVTQANLEAAYTESAPSAVKSVVKDKYNVVSADGGIQIQGLTGVEKVSVFDMTGRKIQISKQSYIALKTGIYIVKIDDFVTKAIVK